MIKAYERPGGWMIGCDCCDSWLFLATKDDTSERAALDRYLDTMGEYYRQEQIRQNEKSDQELRRTGKRP